MSESLKIQVARLRARLSAAEQALRAIRQGEVDAVLAPGPQGRQVFTLRGADHTYRVFLEQMQEGAAALDRQGAVLYANRRLAELLRAPLEKVIGSSFRTWIAPNSREAFEELMGRAAAGPARAELLVRTQDGVLAPVSISGSPAEGEALPALCLVVSDLSEPKRREEELRRQAELLSQARQQLEQQAAELARSNAELEQFAYVAAHDLQEPLRMVTGYCRLLERRYQGKLDAKAERFIAHAVEGAERMQRMIEGLLEYSRVGTRGGPLTPTDSGAILQQACADLRGRIQAAGARVSWDPLPVVMADATQLLRLLENLIGNALKFRGAEPPRVHVSAHAREGEWLFAVRDNGIGIPPAERERIFALFQRLHPRSEYPGEGLGLAIARRIVERHGGRIWVESEPGRGATFYFTLPPAAQAAVRRAKGANAG